MTRPHGRMNKNVFRDLASASPGSGMLRVRNSPPGNYTTDVYGEVCEMQKNSAFVAGAGRLIIKKGNPYLPSYSTIRGGSSVQQSAGSGFLTQSDGVYLVRGLVSVSGVAIETYGGGVYVGGVLASGTQSFAQAASQSAAVVTIHGIVHAVSGVRLNVGVLSLHGNITTIGTEDTGAIAPAANLLVMKLPSEEPNFTG